MTGFGKNLAARPGSNRRPSRLGPGRSPARKVFGDVPCEFGGRDRDRTGDLIVANDALSQLSYSPTSSDLPNVSRGLQKFLTGCAGYGSGQNPCDIESSGCWVSTR